MKEGDQLGRICSECGISSYAREFRPRRNICSICSKLKSSESRRNRKQRDPVAFWCSQASRNSAKRARNKNLDYDLDKDTLVKIVELQERKCAYCLVGIDFRNDSPHLDRVVPGGGYVAGNVVVSCCTCNRRKQDMTLRDLRELLEAVDRVYKRLGLVD